MPWPQATAPPQRLTQAEAAAVMAFTGRVKSTHPDTTDLSAPYLMSAPKSPQVRRQHQLVTGSVTHPAQCNLCPSLEW